MAPRVSWNGDRIFVQIKSKVAAGVRFGTELVKQTVIDKIESDNKNGRIYDIGGYEHQASAPGEPPANFTGRLVSSIESQYSEDGLRGRVTSDADYMPYLEFGTQYMEARPVLRPSLEECRKEIRNYIKREIYRGLKK